MAKRSGNNAPGKNGPVQHHPALIKAANAYNARDMARACEMAQRAFKSAPTWEAAKIAGMAARRIGQRDLAIRMLDRALRLNDDAEARYELAATMLDLGRIGDALPHYEQVLKSTPGHDDAWSDVGSIYLSQRQAEESGHCLRRAVAIAPKDTRHRSRLAQAELQMGRIAESISQLEICVELEPGNAEWQAMLGTAWTLQGRQREARKYLGRALELNPLHERALTLLAAIESNYDFDGAISKYRLAYETTRRTHLLVTMATMLPPIPESREGIVAARERVEREVDRLASTPGITLSLTDLAQISDAQFFFAFHGLDDKPIMQKISRMYRTLCPDLNWVAQHVMNPRPRQGKLRVGFVSMFFFSHSVGLAFRDLIMGMASREDIEVELISLGPRRPQSSEDKTLVKRCQYFLPLAADSLADARDRIAARELDVLVYPDIGMYSFSKFLAHFRLAPMQFVLSGHPDTSGIDTMDYYVSVDVLEVEDAQEHYSERLICLQHAPLWPLDSPSMQLTRSEAGFQEDGHTYFCPMKMQKLHPDFDIAMRRILELDPQARIVLVEDEQYPERNGQLLRRIAKTVPADAMARVQLIPWISGNSRFLATCAAADVVLDSFPFGAGTTAIMLVQLGVPIVTMPSGFAGGRSTGALYELAGITDAVASDLDSYCDIAVRLARDPQYRAELSDRLRASMSGVVSRHDPSQELAKLFFSLQRGHAMPGPIESPTNQSTSMNI